MITVCLLYGFSLGAVILVIFSMPQKSRLTAEKNEWLFEGGFQKLYRAIFGKQDPVKLSKMLGLEYDKYMFDCSIIGKMPDFEKETMMRIVGIFCFFFGIPLAVLFRSVAPLLMGCMAYLILCSLAVRMTHSGAERKKLQLAAEMPRFVDLLLSALEVGLPIELAIIQTADSVPCILSSELKATFAETQLGAKNWQQALEAIAQKYEVDQLSDFVLNIITAYNKGVSVTETVAREAYSVRQSALLVAKERTAKMTSTVLFPLLVFKIIPLIVLLMTPIMLQAMSFYGS